MRLDHRLFSPEGSSGTTHYSETGFFRKKDNDAEQIDRADYFRKRSEDLAKFNNIDVASGKTTFFRNRLKSSAGSTTLEVKGNGQNAFNTMLWQKRIEQSRYLTDKEKADAEKQNLRHIARLKQSFEYPEVKNYFKKIGLDHKSFIAGIERTDIGKMEFAKSVMKNDGIFSDFLFHVLSGQKDPLIEMTQNGERYKKAQELLAEAISEITGDENVTTVFNPKLDLKRAKEIAKDFPIFQGFLHEVQGLARLAEVYIARPEFSDKDFKAQLETILVHNGPQKGFMNMLAGWLPQEAAMEMFKGGMFEKDSKVIYPGPAKPLGYLSASVDRLDQGIEGIEKIFMEIFDMLDLKGVKSNLLGYNQLGTLEQLDALEESIKNSTQDKMTEPQKKFVLAYAKKAKVRVQKFKDYINSDSKPITYSERKLKDGVEERIMQITYQSDLGSKTTEIFNSRYKENPDKSVTFLGAKESHLIDGHSYGLEPIEFTGEQHKELKFQLLSSLTKLIKDEIRLNGEPTKLVLETVRELDN